MIKDVGGNPWVTGISILVALLSIIFTALTARRKGNIDESTLVLGKWKELVEAHEQRIKTMQEDFEAYRRNSREEREALKERVNELERVVGGLEKRLKDKDDEILGLQRIIAQNSQSTAVQIGRIAGVHAPEQEMESLKRLDGIPGTNELKGDGKSGSPP